MNNDRKVVDLNLNDILPNRFQPRIKFDEASILELAESIKEHGVIQPIVVRRIGDKYEIIAGERRYKASGLAGKVTIPAIITELNDKESVEIALIENVQRENLTPIEEAISYRKILDMGYLTQEQLADKLGKTQSTVANKLRLLNLDEDVQEALLEGQISERHARSILKIRDFATQKEILERIITERLTVRRTDEEINKMIDNMNNNESGMVTSPSPISEPIVIDGLATNIPNEPIINDVITPEMVAPTIPSPVETPQYGNQNFNPMNTVEINPTVFGGFPSMNPVDLSPKVEEVPAMNIEHIEQVASPIYEEKPVADMNSLLSPSYTSEVAPVTPLPVVDETTDSDGEEMIMQPGRFFDILGDDSSVTPSTPVASATVEEVPETFSFNNFFNNPVEPMTPEQPSIVTYPSTPIIETPMMAANEFAQNDLISPQVQPIEELPTAYETNVYAPIADSATVPEAQAAVAPYTNEVTPMEDITIPNVQNYQTTENVVPAYEQPSYGFPSVEVVETPVVPTYDMNQVVETPTPYSQTPVVPDFMETPVSNVEIPTTFDIPTSIPTPIVPLEQTYSAPIYDQPMNMPNQEVPLVQTGNMFTGYDNVPETQIETPVAMKDIRAAIDLIRRCSNQIETMGYTIDTDEFDLENMYQVIFKIEK